jgi:hypothetical protein
MEQGLNNLKTIGRRASRPDSQSSPNGSGGHNDDSGIGASGMSDGESGFTAPSRRTSTAMGFDHLLSTSVPDRR